MFEIFICILIIIGLILILSGKARTMLKGFWGLFFTNLAKTPEGAEAIYQEAIEQAQNDYNEASDTLNTLAGKLETSKTNLQKSQEELKNVQDKCEQLAKAGKFDQLDTYSVRLDEVTADVELYTKEVQKYQPLFDDASVVCNKFEATLKKLKKEKSTVIAELKLNSSTKEMYDKLDGLKNVKSTDKLLESVRDGLVESTEQAVGAKTVYNNKTSTKIEKIEQETKSAATNDYIQSLKNKYKNN